MTTNTNVRLATAADAEELAQLLHDFNAEFDTPSPGVDTIATRLARLLAGEHTLAVMSGAPAVGLALGSLRPSVWYDGPVVTVDELYVVPSWRNQGIGTSILQRFEAECRARNAGLIEINVDAPDTDAQRFYERHGFSGVEDHTGERAYFYFRELTAE
jgi:GNAT superfamily N-acetyltransferase